MKSILLLLHLFTFVSLSQTQAQTQQRANDCYRSPYPIPKPIGEQRLAVVTDNAVAVYYVVASDEEFNQAEYDAIIKASREIQAWYQINTGGVTYTFALPDTVVFYQAQQNTSYYQEDWWDKLLPEMQSQGFPIWESGTVASIWIKTGLPNGIGLGAQSCGGYCGVALTGVENFPEFNEYGVCPDNPGGNMWPCVPHATMAHELGHAFGLPHPLELEETQEVAFHSIMQTHWNYPNIAPPDESPWGLLTVERTHLWTNPFFMEDIFLKQIYDADVVNLPVTGVAPAIALDYNINGSTLIVENNTIGAVLFYWTFGDGSVSNEEAPTHTYTMPGTYTVSLRASGETGMTALQEFTITIDEQITPGKKPQATHLGPVKIYPNPSQDGRFNIEYPPLPFTFTLTVMNSLGNVLHSQTVTKTSGIQQLDLSSYGRGVYYMRLEMKGAILTQKLIVL